MNDSSSEPRVRTFRIASGAHLWSLADDHPACPTLREALEAEALESDLIVNLEGLAQDAVLEVLASLLASPRVRAAPREVIVVCNDESVRSLIELSGLSRLVLLEHSLEKALGHALGRTWLASLT